MAVQRPRSWTTAGALALLLATALIGGAAPGPAAAATVEKLLMPGPVSQAHVKQEDSCALCHDRSNRRTQTSLCLDCHKEIATDVRDRRGYHGHMSNSSVGECRACHTEHKGRKADIVRLDRAQFDHRNTDFSLEGAHAVLACEDCHKPGEAWRKVTTGCAACHKSDDVHRGQFTQSCGECHSQSRWSGGRFDHDRTAFRLTGAHTSVTCDACHAGGRYKPAPKSCAGCHATDDEHRGSRGPDCGRCHTTTEWKAAKYDHLKETGYALLGVHDKIDCLACHRSGNYKDRIPKDCAGCHSADDAHAGRFGTACEDCHGNERWHLADYDHAGKHHFALAGAHAKLDCYACHTANVHTQKLAKDCAGCHAAEDPHGGKLDAGCGTCHGEQSWRAPLTFDHDLSSYPLVGLHRVVGCAQCHRTQAFHETPTSCSGCHQQDDVHHGGLGKKCESCHSPNGWSLWKFDHARQTHFPLLGAHAKLSCADCHNAPPGSTKTSSQCASCHHKDDRHLGAYGPQCDRCHTVYSWKGARIQ